VLLNLFRSAPECGVTKFAFARGREV